MTTPMTDIEPKITTSNLNLYYGAKQALHNITMSIPRNHVTALIGPSGCGKSTYLRTLNRMNDLIDSVRIEGDVFLEGTNIYGPDVDVVQLRKKLA